MNKHLLAEALTIRFALIATIALSILGIVTVIAQALTLSHIINRVFLQEESVSDVTTLLLILIVIVVLRAFFIFAEQRTAAQMALRIKLSLRERLMTHLFKLGPTYMQNQRSGDIINTATESIDALDAWYRDFLPGVFTAVMGPLIILAVILPLDLLTFVVLLVTAPLIPVFMVLIGMAAGNLAKEQLNAMNQMSAHFLDVIQGITTLKLFNRSKRQIEIIGRITNNFREQTMRVLRVAFLSAFVLELLATISVAIVAVEIGLRLLHGGIAFQQALFLLIIAPEYYLPLRALGAKFHAGKDGDAAADNIFTILETPLPKQEITVDSVPDQLYIQFRQVQVKYRDDNNHALKGISFDIHPGEKLAIVGTSGSGKSTIASLLLRFTEPDDGEILVDDVPLYAINPTEWRKQIAWVPQRPFLFDNSLAKNIALGNLDTSQQDIIAAARAAQAHQFINALPQGYASHSGEQGAQLSGGQVQRIALARAFLKDAPFIILDEATANLDPETEQQINHALQLLLKDKTALIIAHRLHTLQLADRILVLDNGSIVGDGIHNDLIQHNPHYRQLVQAYTEHSA